MIKQLNIAIMTLFALDYSWFSLLFPTTFLVFIEKVTEIGSQLNYKHSYSKEVICCDRSPHNH